MDPCCPLKGDEDAESTAFAESEPEQEWVTSLWLDVKPAQDKQDEKPPERFKTRLEFVMPVG